MAVAAKTLRLPSWSTLVPRSWSEWRLLASGVLLAGAGLSIYYVREWSRFQAETTRFTQQQAVEIRELMIDLRTARGELRIVQAQNDLLTTRRLLALARRSLELGQLEDAQTHVVHAASFLNAVSPLVLDVNPARLDRLKNEFLIADLRNEGSPIGADRRLTELAGELDGLIGE